MAEYVVIESGSAAKAPTNSSEKISRPAPMEDAPSTVNSMTPPISYLNQNSAQHPGLSLQTSRKTLKRLA